MNLHDGGMPKVVFGRYEMDQPVSEHSEHIVEILGAREDECTKQASVDRVAKVLIRRVTVPPLITKAQSYVLCSPLQIPGW
jgi:hypothetical protein